MTYLCFWDLGHRCRSVACASGSPLQGHTPPVEVTAGERLSRLHLHESNRRDAGEDKALVGKKQQTDSKREIPEIESERSHWKNHQRWSEPEIRVFSNQPQKWVALSELSILYKKTYLNFG